VIDDRAISTALSQTLIVAITTVLVVGLLSATVGFVDDQRRQAARDELTVIGERMAEELVSVDALADGNSTVVLKTDHARRVAGDYYDVTLTDDDDRCGTANPCLVVESDQVRRDPVVPIDLDTPVTESSAPGGRVQFVADGSTIRLESRGDR
jgi:hypothetical protein